LSEIRPNRDRADRPDLPPSGGGIIAPRYPIRSAGRRASGASMVCCVASSARWCRVLAGARTPSLDAAAGFSGWFAGSGVVLQGPSGR